MRLDQTSESFVELKITVRIDALHFLCSFIMICLQLVSAQLYQHSSPPTTTNGTTAAVFLPTVEIEVRIVQQKAFHCTYMLIDTDFWSSQRLYETQDTE